jgi:hypothetical protein
MKQKEGVVNHSKIAPISFGAFSDSSCPCSYSCSDYYLSCFSLRIFVLTSLILQFYVSYITKINYLLYFDCTSKLRVKYLAKELMNLDT